MGGRHLSVQHAVSEPSDLGMGMALNEFCARDGPEARKGEGEGRRQKTECVIIRFVISIRRRSSHTTPPEERSVKRRLQNDQPAP